MIAALALALQAAGPTLPAEDKRQSVFLTWDAEAKACAARINSVETGDVDTDGGKAALLRALPDKGAWIHLLGTDHVPYECVDSVVSALREGGYTRIGFIAEPRGPAR